MYLNFFDLSPWAFPTDGKYYFNILIIDIAVSPKDITDLCDYWDLSHMLDPRPYIYHIYEDKNAPSGEPIVDLIPHTIIETRDKEVSWYEMIPEEDDEDDCAEDEYDEDFILSELTCFGKSGYTGENDWWGLSGAIPC